jgi:hypothetical protein
MVWLALLVMLIAGPTSTGDRIAASGAAAQALQGPLDGTWRLADAEGRGLYVFAIVDPVTPHASLQGAWRAPDGARSGFVDEVHRRRGLLTLRFRDQGAFVNIDLHVRRSGEWSGVVRRGGVRLAVTMRRS